MNRFAILLVLFVGCVPVVRPPGPGPGPQPVSVEEASRVAGVAYAHSLAYLFEAEAVRLEQEQDISAGESHEELKKGREEAREESFREVNKILQNEIGFDVDTKEDRWDQKKAAAVYRKIAKGFRNVR